MSDCETRVIFSWKARILTEKMKEASFLKFDEDECKFSQSRTYI